MCFSSMKDIKSFSRILRFFCVICVAEIDIFLCVMYIVIYSAQKVLNCPKIAFMLTPFIQNLSDSYIDN